MTNTGGTRRRIPATVIIAIVCSVISMLVWAVFVGAIIVFAYSFSGVVGADEANRLILPWIGLWALGIVVHVVGIVAIARRAGWAPFVLATIAVGVATLALTMPLPQTQLLIGSVVPSALACVLLVLPASRRRSAGADGVAAD